MPKRELRIVLTGGHAATTALSVVEEIIRRGKGWDIYWLGTKWAFEGSNVSTLEYDILPARGVKFHSVVTGRLQKKFTRWTIPSLVKVPVGFLHAAYLLIKIRPRVVVSFGGFAAYPVVVVAWLFRIPVVLHEQTSACGRANKLSSFFARKICIARESSRKYFPDAKTVLTGNPLMSQIWEVSPKTTVSKPPTVFVFGGSRGSVFLNDLVLEGLADLLTKYFVIHQTGRADFSRIESHKKKLSKKSLDRYEIYGTLDPMQVDGVYKRADVVVARGGANTVGEIMATKRPAIIIPIPWSAYDEQNENALYAQKFGAATILSQGTAKPGELVGMLDSLVTNYKKIVNKLSKKHSPDKGAEKKVVDVITKCAI